jgi:hypothetical protein
MKTKHALLKLTVVVFGLITIHAFAAPPMDGFCPPFAVFCATDTSVGHCGYKTGVEDCFVCYGDDGSVQVGNPDCNGSFVRATH